MQKTQEILVRFPGREDPLEEEMPTHFSIPASEILWTEEPGGLQLTGLQRVEHNRAHTCTGQKPEARPNLDKGLFMCN